jgi:hypothetical protein
MRPLPNAIKKRSMKKADPNMAGTGFFLRWAGLGIMPMPVRYAQRWRRKRAQRTESGIVCV